jgi:leucyl-tRNA synthetase
VLKDAGMVDVDEPFVRLFNQGMVKRFGQVMSKSKGNGVSPDELVAEQGADAGRVYEMFIGPPEEDVEWTDAGLNGVARFLQRVWRLVIEPTSIVVEDGGADGKLLARKVAQAVKKVTDDYDDLRFNTAVAYLMELANAMQDHLQRGGSRDTAWNQAVETLVKLLNPLAPHVCEEMWERLGREGLLADATWPVYDSVAAAESQVVLVVQVNGKVRDRLNVPVGLSEPEALSAAMASPQVRVLLDGSTLAKVVYVQDRLINLVP